MPRGFLVKRNRRCPASYRSRTNSDNKPETCYGDRSEKKRLTSSPVPGFPEPPFLVRSTQTPASPSIERLLASSSRNAPSYEHDNRYDTRVGHLFPPLTLVNPEQFLEQDQRSRLSRPPAKKPKVNRKLTFEDEVTTSPVLGLRIKKELPGLRRQRERSSGGTANQPLGEYICQLCTEEYPDPFSLAQHKCSRIVRVEYRCPECDKVFSCPANLASHRRWHKPRPVNGRGGETQADEGQPLSPDEGADLPFVQLPMDEAEECRYCGKKFRRQAYLKKHLAAHETARASPSPSSYGQARETSGGQSQVFSCHLCGARFPSAEIRDKHRVWHAVRQVFTCTHCASTFYSSPGLARHVNKSHPAEKRQVMLLQMTVRP
uniref:INSM transcriptional repressor 2 n=1 Tax=Gasterosteus aculeatus TaxID=69293 RepID=G3PG12_GASAC